MFTFKSIKSLLVVGVMAAAGAGAAWAGPTVPPVFDALNTGFDSPSVPLPIPAPPTIPSVLLTYTIKNPNLGGPLTGIAFNVTLSPGLKVANPPNKTGDCGGTFSPVADATSINLMAGNLLAGGSCSISVSVVGVTAGPFTITTDKLSATETGPQTGGLIALPINVVAPLDFQKTFGATRVALCAEILANLSACPVITKTTVTFTIANPSINTVPITGILIADAFPAGFLAAANPVNFVASAGCTAVTPPLPGEVSITIKGLVGTPLDLPPNGTCTFTFDVVGRAVGKRTNTATAAGTNTVPKPASGDLTVVGPPIVDKQFLTNPIKVGAFSDILFTLKSANHDSTASLSKIGFVDDLSLLGIVVTNPNPAGVPVCGGILKTTATVITFMDGTLAANKTCQITVTVTGTQAGVFFNKTSAPTSFETDKGTPGNDTITVLAPPILTKTFDKSSIPLNGFVKATFVLTNPNVSPLGMLTNVVIVDPFPPGLIVAPHPPNPDPTSACNSIPPGLVVPFAPIAGATSVGVTIPTMNPGDSCTFMVYLQGVATGLQTNTATPKSGNAGDGPSSSASVYVVTPVTITKTFAIDPITLLKQVKSNQKWTITFVIKNIDPSVSQSGITFKDTFPLGMTVASPSNKNNSCGGSFNPNPTDGFIQLTAGGQPPLAPGTTCTLTVDVISTTAGLNVNTTDNVFSTEGGKGNTATDTLNIIGPPTGSKTFSPSSVFLGGHSLMTISFTNPNTIQLTSVRFTDTFPSGITFVGPVIVSPSTCGIVVGAPPPIAITGGFIAPGATCTFTADVIGSTVGLWENSVTILTNETDPAGPFKAILNVRRLDPPNSTKVFVPSTILLGAKSTVIITLSNPNLMAALAAVGFTDVLPSGVSNPINESTTCIGGILQVIGNTVKLSGATMPAPPAPGSTCTVTFDVTGSLVGTFTNTVTPGSNAGNGTPASGTLTVTDSKVPPVLKKDFLSQSVLPGGTVGLRFTLSNPNAGPPVTGISFTDTLPTGFTVASPLNGLVDGCTPPGTTFAAPGSNSISVSGVSLNAGNTCTITLNVQADPSIPKPTYICNTTSIVTSNITLGLGDGAPASSCITVGDQPIAPPGAFQIRYASSLDKGDSIINVSNSGANGAPLNGPGFGYPIGNICVNAYVFSPDEQLISCCSTLITPNALNSLSVVKDLVSNTLTGIRPNSVVIKLLSSQPMGSMCSPALPTFNNFAPGMLAWGTTLHTTTVVGAINTTETPFSYATLSASELASITNRCTNIIGNGSSFGQCRTAGLGGLAPVTR